MKKRFNLVSAASVALACVFCFLSDTKAVNDPPEDPPVPRITVRPNPPPRIDPQQLARVKFGLFLDEFHKLAKSFKYDEVFSADHTHPYLVAQWHADEISQVLADNADVPFEIHDLDFPAKKPMTEFEKKSIFEAMVDNYVKQASLNMVDKFKTGVCIDFSHALEKEAGNLGIECYRVADPYFACHETVALINPVNGELVFADVTNQISVDKFNSLDTKIQKQEQIKCPNDLRDFMLSTNLACMNMEEFITYTELLRRENGKDQTTARSVRMLCPKGENKYVRNKHRIGRT